MVHSAWQELARAPAAHCGVKSSAVIPQDVIMQVTRSDTATALFGPTNSKQPRTQLLSSKVLHESKQSVTSVQDPLSSVKLDGMHVPADAEQAKKLPK